ncbi:MAG: hypothetical protein HUJ51_00190 [Eggerthellaceae bacterium]|nr:hypothetical protein [Eggerthellaceae bacterium]
MPLFKCLDELLWQTKMGYNSIIFPEDGQVFEPCDDKIKYHFYILLALGIESNNVVKICCN